MDAMEGGKALLAFSRIWTSGLKEWGLLKGSWDSTTYNNIWTYSNRTYNPGNWMYVGYQSPKSGYKPGYK